MSTFKNILPGLSGAASPQAGVDSSASSGPTDPITDDNFPGVPLFVCDTEFTAGAANSLGERVCVVVTPFNCIQFIHNDGFFNTAASDTDMQMIPAPTMNVLCDYANYMPFRILRVLDADTIVIHDPQENYTGDATYLAQSQLQPNRKAIISSADLLTIVTMGGAETNAPYNGANYIYEIGDGVTPLEIFGAYSAGTFNATVIK